LQVVSVGTIVSIGAIGAIVAVGYAVYRNADKISGALSRGVEGYFTNPLGSYFENLFTNLPTPPVSSGSGSGNGTQVPTLSPDAPVQESGLLEGFEGSPQGPKLPDDKNLLQTAFDIWYKEHFGSPTVTPPLPTITDVTPPGPIPQSTPPLTQQYQEGYYYVNYEGSQYDTQWYLNAEQAASVAETAAAKGDPFLGIKYLGKSMLGAEGFKTFGQSQNYL